MRTEPSSGETKKLQTLSYIFYFPLLNNKNQTLTKEWSKLGPILQLAVLVASDSVTPVSQSLTLSNSDYLTHYSQGVMIQ